MIPNLVILISGRGSNMRSLIEASHKPHASYRVALVLSDQPEAAGLNVAAELGIPARALPAQGFARREAYDQCLCDAVHAAQPALVALAGFMRILGPAFVHTFAGRLVNIHPSLLPLYKGLHTHRRAIEAGDVQHGATVHYVTEELDGGPGILQARVPVLPDDDVPALSARVQQVEHRIFPLAVQWHCAGRIACRGDQVFMDGCPLDRPLIWNESMQ